MASAAAPAAVSSKNAPSRPVIDLYFAGHRVEDSDGALAGLARVRHGGFAIEFSDTSYWERRPTLDNPDDRIRMDMWSFNLQGRLVAVNRTALWVVGGIGATSSTEFPTIQGPLLGGRITHDFAPGLAGELGARWYVLEQGVRATELRASVRASVFTIGYRRLEFNVGPPLQGPEAGVTLRF